MHRRERSGRHNPKRIRPKTFKIAKAATSSADLNLKLSKPVVSPASSLSADQVAKTDLITGGKFSAAGIQEKVIAGAGTQDIAHADQIIGILDRGSQSSLDQFGLHSPSVQNPGGDLKNTLDIGAYIDAYDASLRLNDVSAGADKVGYCEGAAYFMQGVGAGVSVASKYIASTVPVPQAKGVALGGFFAGLIINGAGSLLSYACTGRSTGGGMQLRVLLVSLVLKSTRLVMNSLALLGRQEKRPKAQ